MTRRRRGVKKPTTTEQWYKADLHIHTPASADYQQEGVSCLDILREAEHKGIDIPAFTDHNTVAGYRAMQDEIDDLELLERVGRLNPQERQKLLEYRRLLDRVLLLRGFEFTATFGFHILGIFDPDTPLRDLEFLLLKLNLPPDRLDEGATDIGATSDVLTAYQMIARAGGIVIAAHAKLNERRGPPRAAVWRADAHRLHPGPEPARSGGHRSGAQDGKTTARFFDGSKPEYPRRMRCIQGSDAHRVTRQADKPRNLGVGDRVTEVLLTGALLQSPARGVPGGRLRPHPSLSPAGNPR